MRYTKKFIETRARYAFEACGMSFGAPYEYNEAAGRHAAVVGRYYLTHNSTYGGYNIEQIVNESGGCRVVTGGRGNGAWLVSFIDGMAHANREARLRAEKDKA